MQLGRLDETLLVVQLVKRPWRLPIGSHPLGTGMYMVGYVYGGCRFYYVVTV